MTDAYKVDPSLPSLLRIIADPRDPPFLAAAALQENRSHGSVDRIAPSKNSRVSC